MTKQSPKPASGNVPDNSAKPTLPAEYSQYHYENSIAFGIKLSVLDARRVSEHAHGDVQILIPLGDTLVEARWRMPNGRLRRSYAQRGHVVVVPPHHLHAVSWNNRAYFVNLHIGADTSSEYGRTFLQSIAEAGKIHVIEDQFLTTLAENIVVIANQMDRFDIDLLRAIRLIIESHVTRTYKPRPLTGRTIDQPARTTRKIAATDNPSGPGGRSGRHSAGRTPQILSALAPWQLRKVLTAIESDLRHDFSVVELAALLNLSTGHFSRAFRASTQLSPRQWIIRHRIETAMDMLRQTDQLIADIAITCGFSEQGHFTRKFKQITGLSPTAWRRSNKL